MPGSPQLCNRYEGPRSGGFLRLPPALTSVRPPAAWKSAARRVQRSPIPPRVQGSGRLRGSCSGPCLGPGTAPRQAGATLGAGYAAELRGGRAEKELQVSAKRLSAVWGPLQPPDAPLAPRSELTRDSVPAFTGTHRSTSHTCCRDGTGRLQCQFSPLCS